MESFIPFVAERASKEIECYIGKFQASDAVKYLFFYLYLICETQGGILLINFMLTRISEQKNTEIISFFFYLLAVRNSFSSSIINLIIG